MLVQMHHYSSLDNKDADSVNDVNIISQFYGEKIEVLRLLREDGVRECDCCGKYFTGDSLVQGHQTRPRSTWKK